MSAVVESRPQAWPGPETVVQHRLSNGLAVYIYQNPTVPAVVIDGALRAGSVDEPLELSGLAALTAGMLRRGTRTHSFEALNEMIDAVGAAIELGGGRHAIDLYANCLSEDLDLVTGLLADMLCHPAFPGAEFDRLKAQTLTHIRERENDTRSMASLTFRRLLYGEGHPYSRPVIGEADTVNRITLEDVHQFYRCRVGPEHGHLVVVGDVDPDAVIARLEETLGGWTGAPAPEQHLPPVPPLNAARSHHVDLPDKRQTDIVLGWLGIPRRHPDWTPMVVANTVLGRFGMGGRLGTRVREKQGMAYYAYGNVDGNFGPGAWTAIAGVAPENVGRAVESMLAEVRRLQEEPVPAEELADSQEFLIGSMPLRLETNHGIASVLSDIVWFDLGLDYLRTLEERVRSVTPAAVQRVAQAYLNPQVYALATAGPGG